MSSSIPLSKLDEGIQRAIDNATRYLNDAVFLYDNKKYQSSILLSMLSYEESGKALLLMDYKKEKKEITKRQWRKKFCSHTMKNLISTKKIWQDAGYDVIIEKSLMDLAKFTMDWKNVYTYVDFDFENLRWTTPLVPEEFKGGKAESFSYSSMSRAAEVLKCILRRWSNVERNK